MRSLDAGSRLGGHSPLHPGHPVGRSVERDREREREREREGGEREREGEVGEREREGERDLMNAAVLVLHHPNTNLKFREGGFIQVLTFL